GGVFGLIAMYLRRWLQETPIFLEMQQRKALAQDPLPAGRRIWSDSDVSAPLAAGDADFS
ncbi:hypothetical protein CKQ90_36130, partial [Klebsiella pneumoniae]